MSNMEYDAMTENRIKVAYFAVQKLAEENPELGFKGIEKEIGDILDKYQNHESFSSNFINSPAYKGGVIELVKTCSRQAIVKKVKRLTGSSSVRSKEGRNGLVVKITNWNSNLSPEQVVNKFAHAEYYRMRGEFLFPAPNLEC